MGGCVVGVPLRLSADNPEVGVLCADGVVVWGVVALGGFDEQLGAG